MFRGLKFKLWNFKDWDNLGISTGDTVQWKLWLKNEPQPKCGCGVNFIQNESSIVQSLYLHERLAEKINWIKIYLDNPCVTRGLALHCDSCDDPLRLDLSDLPYLCSMGYPLLQKNYDDKWKNVGDRGYRTWYVSILRKIGGWKQKKQVITNLLHH